MTTELLTNRYRQKTPTHIQPNGCAVATPIYLTPTSDQTKALLNGFRNVVLAQRLELGYVATPSSSIGVEVVNATKSPQTPAEIELGMSEEALRYALFARKGLPERLVFKLQELTGVTLVTREVVEATMKAWLDALSLPYENKRTKGTRKTSKSATTAAPAA